MNYVSQGSGDHAVVFVHGFLDAASVWDDIVARLSGIECVQLNLAGMGERKNTNGPFSLDRFAADVGAVVDAIGKPFLIVGHSLGAQVAELVAAQRPDRAAGLVLLTPVPLGGAGLSTADLGPFRALGGDHDAQIVVRRQLTVELTADKLQRLAEPGFEVRPDVVTALVDAWNAGHPDGVQPGRYRGSVRLF
ncbi:MAG: alpha/beta fold hydrolase [Pseudomonas sp.]